MKRPGFTLVEMLVTVALTGVILTSGYAAFQSVMRAQSRLATTIDVQKNLFYISEKIGHLIRSGGTIDYEEYFNRRILGYDQGMNNEQVFTFEEISKFGNGDNTGKKPDLYYCFMQNGQPSNLDGSIDNEACFDKLEKNNKSLVKKDGKDTIANGTHIGYGQYRALGLNYGELDYPVPIMLPSIFKSGGEVGMYNLTDKIEDVAPTSTGLPELYLIREEANGNMIRTYFRHVYITDENAAARSTCTPATNLDNCRGKIQMTQLRSCDEILPKDGIIDAWIPATNFSSNSPVGCPGNATEISTAADGLIWLDITSPDLDVVRAAFFPYPHQIPELMRLGTNTSPRVTLRLDIRLSERLARRSALAPGENQPRIIMTTYELTQ